MSNVSAPAPTASGTLEKTPVPGLLAYAVEQRLTGTLELTADSASATLVFFEGWPTKARTSEPAYLGGVLHGLGLIDDSQLNASLGRMAAERKLHGRILVEMGALDPPRLLRGLIAQLARKLEHVAQMPPKTTFAYFAGTDALAAWGGPEVVRVDPLPIIWSMLRANPPWPQVNDAIARVERGVVMRIPPGMPIERMRFERRELELVDMIRHRAMSLRELQATQLLSVHATQLFVYCLMITKQLTLAAQAPEAAHARSGPIPAPGPMATPMATPGPMAAPMRIPTSPQMRVPVSGVSQPLPAGQGGRVPTPPPMQIPPAPRMPSSPDLRPPPSSGSGVPSSQDTASSSRMVAAPPVRSRSVPPGPLSAPPSHVQLTPELAELRQSIIDRVAAMASQTHFEVLDLKKDASPDAVQKRFVALAKTWHPDRLAPQLFDVRELAEKLFVRMSEAHAVLTDPEKRAGYVAEMSRGLPRLAGAAPVVANAHIEFQKADVFMKKRDLKTAEEHARRAHEADPSKADYLALLVWIQIQRLEGEPPFDILNKHVDTLDRALKLDERCERAYYARATLYKRLGKNDKAYLDFKQSAELNPHNVDSAREVRLYRMRADAKKPAR
jgi:hypothetical protein